ncbi:MAG: GIY-YIG nuclease family protein, partial [candidate division Zixibacteria bacterium]|nr:GIY-YIG nuclease family protein [candidate division Zixibacteria bacterium]
GSYYTGITKDIPSRIKRHNAGKGAKYTRSHRPVKLIYIEEYEIESEVRKREHEVKGWRREKKERLICGFPSSILKDFLRISGQ